MITIKIRTWEPIGGVLHIATDYQVASDRLFATVIDNNLNDSNNLTVYYSPAVIPVNQTYYIRVRRVFNNGTSSGWGDTIAVTNTKANDGVLSYEPVKVFQPVVTIDKAVLDDPLQLEYTVSTNDFIGLNEGHGYTVWMVLDDKDNVIEYVKSTTDLTSITFFKGIDKLVGTKHIKVIAIHGTLTNIESAAGEVIINVTNVNFSLSVESDVMRAGKDLTVALTRPANLTNTEISKVVLTDINGTEMWTKVVDSTINSVTVPGSLLLAGTQYEIVGYGIPANMTNRYILPIKTMPDHILDVQLPGYVYKRTISRNVLTGFYSMGDTLRGVTTPSGVMVSASSSRLRKIITEQDGTYTTGGIFTSVFFSAINSNNMYMRMLPNDKMLTVTKRTTTGSVIHVLGINYYDNTHTIDAVLNVIGKEVSANNGVVFISPDRFYACHPGYDRLRLHTILPAQVTWVVKWLPAGETSLVAITKDVGNNILVFCTDSKVIYSYDTDTGTYINKYVLPIEFRGRSLKQEELVNGDVIVWKPYNTETVNGVAVTDTILDMLYIDNTNNTITHIQPLTGRNYDITGSVVTSDGKVLLITNETVGTNVLVFE